MVQISVPLFALANITGVDIHTTNNLTDPSTLTATFCDGYSCCTTAALTDLTDSAAKSLTDDEMAGCKGFPFSGAGTLNGVDAQLQHDGPDNWIGYAEITLDGGSVVSVGSSTASVTAGNGDNVLAPVAHVSLVV